MRRRVLMALGATASLAVRTQLARAQAAYPSRPIRLITTVPPGGAPDVAARIIARSLQERLGHTVVVDNRAGSNGLIAAEAAARAQPDGHTLLFAQDTVLAVNPWLYEKSPVNVATELLPVASVAGNQFILAVNPKLPAQSLAEFVALARAADPPLAYASGGIGSQHQLAMELLMRRADIRLLHVPFRGGTPAVMATVSGDTAAVFSGTSSAALAREGRLRALAATGPRRSAQFQDLPTIGETYPGYELTIWLGVFAPTNTPPAVVSRLREQINAALAESEVRQQLDAGGGLEPLRTSPEEFAELIRGDREKYGNLIREIGLKLE